MQILKHSGAEAFVSMISFDDIADGFERLERGEVRGRLIATISE